MHSSSTCSFPHGGVSFILTVYESARKASTCDRGPWAGWEARGRREKSNNIWTFVICDLIVS
eukprot:scaffold683_cov71-Skeletonema_dohrnii-CCMP3373.AAC.2